MSKRKSEDNEPSGQGWTKEDVQAWKGQTVPIEEPPSPAQVAETERKLGELLRSPASEGVANPYSGFAEPDKGTPPDQSAAGGKRKGPRKPRSPARTVCYVEKLMSRFTLAQRKAMYAMLSSVTEPTLTDTEATP